MKKLVLFVVCVCLLALTCVCFADGTEAAASDGYTVTYIENNCLGSVPTDETVYQKGDKVTVLFDPVTYTDNQIFYGWDMNGDGIADFGYAYNTFTMPENNVELKAICIPAYTQYAAPAPHGGPHGGPIPGFEPDHGPQPQPGFGQLKPAPKPDFGPENSSETTQPGFGQLKPAPKPDF